MVPFATAVSLFVSAVRMPTAMVHAQNLFGTVNLRPGLLDVSQSQDAPRGAEERLAMRVMQVSVQ